MEKVFVVFEYDGCMEESISGIYSTKEKAELAINALKHLGHCGSEMRIMEYTVDREFERITSYLEQELKQYEKCATLCATLLRDIKES